MPGQEAYEKYPTPAELPIVPPPIKNLKGSNSQMAHNWSESLSFILIFTFSSSTGNIHLFRFNSGLNLSCKLQHLLIGIFKTQSSKSNCTFVQSLPFWHVKLGASWSKMQFEATKAVCYLDHLTHHTFPETKMESSKNVPNFWHQFSRTHFIHFTLKLHPLSAQIP